MKSFLRNLIVGSLLGSLLTSTLAAFTLLAVTNGVLVLAAGNWKVSEPKQPPVDQRQELKDSPRRLLSQTEIELMKSLQCPL